MANVLKISKLTALPTTLDASAMYLIPNATAGFLDIYVTNSAGTVANKIVSKQDVTTTGTVNLIEATYTALAAITPTSVEIAYVKNASDDTRQTPAISGGAMYIWDTSLATPAWTLMDTTVQQWANIVGIPAVLTSLTDSGGFLAYSGVIIPTYLATEAW